MDHQLEERARKDAERKAKRAQNAHLNPHLQGG